MYSCSVQPFFVHRRTAAELTLEFEKLRGENWMSEKMMNCLWFDHGKARTCAASFALSLPQVRRPGPPSPSRALRNRTPNRDHPTKHRILRNFMRNPETRQETRTEVADNRLQPTCRQEHTSVDSGASRRARSTPACRFTVEGLKPHQLTLYQIRSIRPLRSRKLGLRGQFNCAMSTCRSSR